METAIMGPEIGRSALIIVDMQNDFVHADGRLAQKAREIPDAAIDMSFLMGTIPYVEATRRRLPSGWTARDLDRARTEANYSDAQIPYWRLGLYPGGNRTFITEGTWGAQVVDELKPLEGEHLIVKKGFGGFGTGRWIPSCETVTTCVVSGVTTCVCVSTTVRGGVDHNYRMILVSDAAAEVSRETHEAELKTMDRVFADVKCSWGTPSAHPKQSSPSHSGRRNCDLVACRRRSHRRRDGSLPG
jgi:nicotinamidase-related amidase